MSDFFDEPSTPRQATTEPLAESTADSDVTPIEPRAETGPGVDARSEPPESVAETRFKSCRWRESQDNGPPYCSNRDVLPFAGKNGFKPEAWCPECALYKVKRTVKKRPIEDYD